MVFTRLQRRLMAVGVMLAGLAGFALQAATPAQSSLSAKTEQVAQASVALPGSMLLAQSATPPRTVSACMTCHGSTPKYPILGARMTYDHSTHKNGGNSAYANGGGCQKCHTNEGFIDFVKTGKVDDKAFVKYPSQQGCFTCHAPHENGDMRLRTTKAVTLATGVTFDSGSGNLCANCHQARTAVKDTVKAMAAKDISSPWGAHHGPQADMMMGSNAYEFAGKEYAGAGDHASAIDDGCVSCHMSLPDGRYGFSPNLGGHSFNISGDVHEAEKLNTTACVSCHKDMKQAVGTRPWIKAGGPGVIWIDKPAVFGITAPADYDRDGQKEYMQDEVQGLMDRLVNQQGNGLLQQGALNAYDAKGNYILNKATTNLSADQVGALYNFKYVLEDRSRGVHNATYTVQVLYDTVASLDPKFDTALRPK